MRTALLACVLAACGPAPRGHGETGGDDTGDKQDAAVDDSGGDDGSMGGGDGGGDGSMGGGGDAPIGVITGGPCLSGQQGKTAYRVRWAKSGSTAYVVYEVNGLPDHSRDHTGAFGYQIGFTPSYVDPFLDVGGLQLDGSDFVDIELTTAGV